MQVWMLLYPMEGADKADTVTSVVTGVYDSKEKAIAAGKEKAYRNEVSQCTYLKDEYYTSQGRTRPTPKQPEVEDDYGVTLIKVGGSTEYVVVCEEVR